MPSLIAQLRQCLQRSKTGIVLLLILGLFLTVSGCRNPQVVWSTAANSPDGKWIATAKASANEGFGVSGAPGTFVYLNWSTGSQKPREILEFSEDTAGAPRQSVELHWVSPQQLNVVFQSDKQEVQFQAVKFADVEIDLKEGTTNTTVPSR